MELRDLDTQKLAVGKAAVFYAPTAWDFASDLHASLVHVGFTEGEVSIPFNESTNELTLPEYTGDAPHAAYIQGEAPVATIPFIAADPSLRTILSPTGHASGGFKRQRPVQERTVVIIPEELFVDVSDPDRQDELTLTPSGTEWLLEGSPLSTAQQELMDLSIWFWRGYWMKPQYRFVHEGGGKIVEPTEFHVMYQVGAPNGHRLYTLGDPYDAGIDPASGLISSS